MSEFDQFSDSYGDDVDSAICIPGVKHDIFIASKVNYVKKLFELYGINKKSKVLDLGCGVGMFDSYIEDSCDLYGCDVSKDSIVTAREHNKKTTYSLIENEKLPYDDKYFDFAFTINVMHHVPPDDWKSFLLNAYDVLKIDSPLCVFEHNPYNPLTQKVVRDCV